MNAKQNLMKNHGKHVSYWKSMHYKKRNPTNKYATQMNIIETYLNSRQSYEHQ